MSNITHCANGDTAEGILLFVSEFYGKEIFSIKMEDKGRSFRFVFFESGIFDKEKNGIFIREGNKVYYEEGAIEKDFPDKFYFTIKKIVDDAISEAANSGNPNKMNINEEDEDNV